MASYFAAATLGVVGLSLVADRLNWNAGYQVMAGVAAITALLFLTLMPKSGTTPETVDTLPDQSPRLVKASTFGVFALAFLVSGGLTTFLVYIGAFLKDSFHVTTVQIALVFVVAGSAAVISAPIAGTIADRIGMKPMIIGGNLIMAVAFALIPHLKWGALLFVIFGLAEHGSRFTPRALSGLYDRDNRTPSQSFAGRVAECLFATWDCVWRVCWRYNL